MGQTVLKTENLTKEFKGLIAVDDLSVSFEQDHLYAIIGPNGAGKTTFFNLLSGVLDPTTGTIRFKGEDITTCSLEEVAQKGLARSYQTNNLFNELTAFENIRIAAQSKFNGYNFWADIDDIPELNDRTEELLQRLNLTEARENLVSELSHGERRTLEIAVALGTDPDFLLMDEPTSGISPEETDKITDIIDRIADDIPVVVVEHKMSVVRRIADQIVVLHNGKKIAEGPPEVVRNNAQVREVYLQEKKI